MVSSETMRDTALRIKIADQSHSSDLDGRWTLLAYLRARANKDSIAIELYVVTVSYSTAPLLRRGESCFLSFCQTVNCRVEQNPSHKNVILVCIYIIQSYKNIIYYPKALPIQSDPPYRTVPHCILFDCHIVHPVFTVHNPGRAVLSYYYTPTIGYRILWLTFVCSCLLSSSPSPSSSSLPTKKR